MNPRKSQCLAFRGRRLDPAPHALLLVARAPPAQKPRLIEQQLPRSLPRGHRQRHQSPRCPMRHNHARQIDPADHIHIVHNKRCTSPGPGIALTRPQKPGRLLQPAARIEQRFLPRNLNPHSEILVRRQKLHNLIRKVMRIHHRLAHAKATQPLQHDLQQRTPCHSHQCLRPIVR